MLSKNSRYIDTTELTNSSGENYFALWERVDELRQCVDALDYFEHTIVQREVGCIDIIAERYYNNERLWWFIAAFNGIIDPVKEMEVGKVLLIPNQHNVLNYRYFLYYHNQMHILIPI